MSYKKKVLIIDDEPDFCIILKAHLLRKGYEAFIAHTWDNGLKLLKSVSPDIIFLDNNLPDGLGWEKANDISREFPLAKLNLISAYKQAIPGKNSHHLQICEKPLDLRSLDQYL